MDSFEQILQRMEAEYEEKSGGKVEDVSEVGLRLRVLAGELHRLGASLDWLERQAFPQTATGAQLDLHGAQRGVARRAASHATGTVSFSRYLPLSFDLVVPQGTVCATSGEPVVEYETTQDAVLEAGDLTVNVPVRAVVAGAAGNAAAGYVTTLVSAPTGINYASNQEAITGGRDPEEDDTYRRRVLDSIVRGGSGANAGYYQEIALAQPGVTLAQAVPRAGGAGTVTVYLWGEGVAPSGEAIAAVQAELEAQREIGVTVTVTAAQVLNLPIPVKVKLPSEVDFIWATAQVQQAVTAYFDTLGIGEAYLLTDITRAVLEAVPAEKVEFGAGLVEISPMNGTLIRPTSVTVEALS